MDLPPWFDDQAYQTSFAYENGYYTEENLLDDFSFHYGRDMLEEDALNEKSCMQVLKIWIDKADEDIVKLEEDILMLQCHQLAWDDEEWSKQCSAALREKIDGLDVLIESLKKDDRENGLQSETEELPQRLHDFLKPLLESYLAKSKLTYFRLLAASLPLNDEQTETDTSIIKTPDPAAVEPSNKKSEEKAGTIVLKTYERKRKSMELEERRISLPHQEKDTVIKNFDANGDMSTNNELSEKVMSKPSSLEGRRMLNLVRVKLEPVDSMVNDSSSVTSIENANSRENEKKRNISNKAITEAKSVQGSVQHEIKVINEETGSHVSGTVEGNFSKPQSEASSEVQKPRVYKRGISNSTLSTKPSVKIKGTGTKIPQTPDAAKDDDRTEQVKKPRMEPEHQIQGQQKCKECQQVLRISSTEYSIEQNHEIEIKKIASEVSATPIVLPRQAKQLPLSSQISKDNEGLKSSVMKLEIVVYDASNSAAEEAMDGVKNLPQLPFPFNKSKEKLTLTNLRAIARNRQVRGYSKLRKEHLKILLGLD